MHSSKIKKIPYTECQLCIAVDAEIMAKHAVRCRNNAQRFLKLHGLLINTAVLIYPVDE